mmetsp:Transcript_10408/g.16990  ORF Transcript_10408/g.16990 Transcript_10408/m.16990 type:complete len:97 (-) Transcript_10408:29-319(-)
MDMMPKTPEGILDMMGPRTLDGGYSPSQVMSSASAMKRDVDLCSSILGANETWLTRVAVCATGAKAVEIATMAARRRRLSFAILEYIEFLSVDFIH